MANSSPSGSLPPMPSNEGSGPYTLEFLETRLAALEREVVTLKERLALDATRPTLRQQGVCPCCGSRRVFYAPDVLDRGESNTRLPMAVATTGFWRQRPQGAFELFACVACGFVEWYVREPSQLEELPKEDPKYVVLDTDAREPGGPYR
jgi:hypothetical protein